MHTDERAADVYSGPGTDVLDRCGALQPLPQRSRERASRVRPRADVDDLLANFFGRRFVEYQRAVEVLAALRGEIYPALLHDRPYPVQRGLRRLHA